VLWEQTVNNIVRDGGDRFCEIGPGKVLQGLIKRTTEGATTQGFDKYADVTTGTLL
jgi:[acyl-carrier-protein] S-malonyltransferase